jgi:hypothetical protein
MSMRKFEALVGGLPFDGALARSLDPHRKGVGWTRTDDFMALIAELIDYNNRQYFAFNVKKGTKIPQPIFIPRPYEPQPERDSSPKSVARLMRNLEVRVVKDQPEEDK